MSKLIDLIIKKSYLTWYVKDKASLSEQSALEHILNYGTWEDFLELENNLGLKKLKQLFEVIKSNRRVNLRAKTLNYFDKYLQKYA